MTDPDPDVDRLLGPDEIWLCNRPVDRASLRAAQRILANMEDLEGPKDGPQASWVVAARLAVREVLRDKRPDGRPDHD